MALSPSHFKEKYKNCSVEELESRFNELRKEVEFKTKKEFLKHYMDNLLYPSKNSNLKYESKAIQELLYDKTGNTYEFEKNKFTITLNDVIDYVGNSEQGPFFAEAIREFLNKLVDISNNEKINFLMELYQDQESFNEFTKEILKTDDIKETFDKYEKIARDYYKNHRVI